MHPVTVRRSLKAGMSERPKYWRKGWANPVTRGALAGGHVKRYHAGGGRRWDHALISIHVMDHGWALKDADRGTLLRMQRGTSIDVLTSQDDQCKVRRTRR